MEVTSSWPRLETEGTPWPSPASPTQVFHKIITSGHQRLQPLFDCLLTIIVNGRGPCGAHLPPTHHQVALGHGLHHQRFLFKPTLSSRNIKAARGLCTGKFSSSFIKKKERERKEKKEKSGRQ